MLTFDHLAVTATSLEDGVAWVEAALGVPMSGGGKHPHMATHNRLLGLGDLYLEAIAIDPAAPTPAHPRWFDLDHFAGPPRPSFWVARTADIDAALIPGFAPPTPLSRGDYRWLMAASANGSTPFDGAYPALIQWQGPLHPTAALPDSNVRLTRLEVAHPDPSALRAALPLNDPRVIIVAGPAKALRATFATPHGTRILE